MESLYSEFRAVDNLVAHNTARVLKAFQNARVGSHVRICAYLFGWPLSSFAYVKFTSREFLERHKNDLTTLFVILMKGQNFSWLMYFSCAKCALDF